MKIRTAAMSYEDVLALKPQKHKKPMKQLLLFRLLLRIVSMPDLLVTGFKCEKIGMEKLGKKEPCLILMNHSSFIDLKIASTILFPRAFNIVCTSDGFVGKNWLMRLLGCIPTRKFQFDVGLVKDMLYAVKDLNSSILMYPEASYSFDGTATPLPESLGKCLKLLKVPVVMISTKGAFARDPLYNSLQLRKVKVSATMEYLLSPQDITEKSAEELNEILAKQFSFDHFKWQQENNVRIREKFRADGLNRVLYKCPHCKTEGQLIGKGIHLTCSSCGKKYELTEYGYIQALDGETEFPHIPDWYQWERDCVRQEIESGSYYLERQVDIYMLVNTRCVYHVGEGCLIHSKDGFHLTGCSGMLEYSQKPSSSYSLYSDFCWYEIGDMICIGDDKAQYYCFPKDGGDIVAKTRLATEEMYKIGKKNSVRTGRKKAVS
ncbi:MAG: 1-acyl-sn-glycerol-3-phosphate acyltransferase [Lachnospiraceae bacterium]|nr:1-acyl-sn-glycerol-3-phosphate acyltransferase [Lachnospiraceae bacterium]